MASVNVSRRFRAKRGMTWNLGGYWGEEVAIRDTCFHFVKLHLRIATSSPHVLLNSVVIPSPHTNLHTRYYDN